MGFGVRKYVRKRFRDSFSVYAKERLATWLEDLEDEWYEMTSLDGWLLAMLIWAVVLYVMGFWQGDLLITGIGGIWFVLILVGTVARGILEDFHKWQRGEG